MPVTGDTIVTLADGSRTAVCYLEPGMVLATGSKIRTITVRRFTGWLYTVCTGIESPSQCNATGVSGAVGPHFITTGTTLRRASQALYEGGAELVICAAVASTVLWQSSIESCELATAKRSKH